MEEIVQKENQNKLKKIMIILISIAIILTLLYYASPINFSNDSSKKISDAVKIPGPTEVPQL